MKRNFLFQTLAAAMLPMYMSEDAGDAGDFDLGILGDVLDRPLSEIAELPTYETPPLGRYKLFVEGKPAIAKIKDNDTPVLRLTYTIMEVKELKDQEEDGAFFEGKEMGSQKFSTQYMFGGDPTGQEMTLSSLKTTFGVLAAPLGVTSLKELMKKICQGVIIEATMKHRYDKKDRSIFYPNVVEVTLAA